MLNEVGVKEVETDEIVPDANLEVAKTVAELKSDVENIKKLVNENKVDATKEKAVSPIAPEKKADVGDEMVKWIDRNMNKGWNQKGLIEGSSSTGSTMIVPKPVNDEILRQVSETGLVRMKAKKYFMDSETLTITITDTEPEAIWHGQAVSADTTSATYTDVTFTRGALEVKTVVSAPLLQDKKNIVPHLVEVGAQGIRLAEDKVAFGKLATSAGNTVSASQGYYTSIGLTDMRKLYNAGTHNKMGVEFYMHPNMWSYVQGLSDNVTIVDFTNQKYFGVPVNLVPSMTDPLSSDGTSKTYIIATNLGESLGLGIRNDETVDLRMSDSATVGGVSMFDTNQVATKFLVDEDIQVLRSKYVSKLTSKLG